MTHDPQADLRRELLKERDKRKAAERRARAWRCLYLAAQAQREELAKLLDEEWMP